MISDSIRLSGLIAPVYHDLHRAIRGGTFNQFVLKGGRGSAKSSTVSLETPLQLIKHPEVHAVVLRKVANTLRTSVYAQYVWAIPALGLSDLFKVTVSPMEITYKPTGQKIMFFGADDPGKIKSIKVPFGYIGILHFEELDQFTEEEVRNIEQSVLRGGPVSLEFKTFNPPRTAMNWANKYCLVPKPGQLVFHTDYRDIPREWLGERFLADAEHLKEVNPAAYEHEYLGKPNGNGGMVFDQLELRTITDEEIAQFDRIYQGEDWGWYPDPFAFERMHYDTNRETLFFIDELYGNRMSNEQTGKWIKARGYDDYIVTADSAEPKSINDHIDLGIRCVPAIKGPGSVEYGMKWLQRRKIVIDPQRTPNAAREFSEYEYARDRDGNVISGYPDANNHTIDAGRYGVSPLFMRRGNTA